MYLEAQSDQLVHSIQATLSLVRMTPTPPSLDEHLAQIVTIVASIVAVFKDSIPPNASSATAKTVAPLITELSEQVDRLSELQGMEENQGDKEPNGKEQLPDCKRTETVAEDLGWLAPHGGGSLWLTSDSGHTSQRLVHSSRTHTGRVDLFVRLLFVFYYSINCVLSKVLLSL